MTSGVFVGGEEREGVEERLTNKGIARAINYPVPIHMQPVYGYLGTGERAYPVTESVMRKILSLPMYRELSEEAVKRIVEGIKAWAQQCQ